MVSYMKNLSDCFEEFINEKKCYCEPRTIEYYEENLSEFIKYVAHQELSKQIYIDYICQLRKKGIKNTSIRTYCRAVKVFSNWLYDNNYIDMDFTKKVKLPRDDHEIIMPLSRDEVDSIDKCIVDVPVLEIGIRNKIIIHLMLDCGLRRNEVINLRKKDVSFEDNIIYVCNSKYNKNRVVLLPDFLAIQIKWYGKFYSVMSKKSEYLLLKADGNQLTKDTIKCIFRKLKKSTGIDRLHPHLLRHTFATSYILYCGNLEKLRILLGHSDYNVTRNYLHISAQMLLLHYDIYKLDDIYFRKD